jgi:hypothetical protein
MTAQAPKKRTCARCGHPYLARCFLPEGHLCYRCLDAALALAGTCPGCGTPDRALPGLRDGERICRDGAGITRDFSCLRCGTETGMGPGSRRGLSRLCDRCAVAWTAARLLDDGTGAIAAPLKPLADALAGSASPAATLEWLRNRTSATCSPALPPARCRSPMKHSMAGHARGPSPTCGLAGRLRRAARSRQAAA